MSQAEFFYRDPLAPKPNRPNHLGAAVLIEYEGRILMEHRADSENWAFIGGGLELDETLAQCALREIREETGMVLTESDLEFFRLYDDPSRIIRYPDGNIIRSISIIYRAHLKEIPVLHCSEESRELKFCTLEEIKNLPVAATHRHILEDLSNELSRNQL